MVIWLFLVFFFSTLFPLFHLFNAIDWRRSKREQTAPPPEKEEKGFSILIPCYNESLILQTALEGLKQLKYSNFEVIFINDGSTDSTIQSLQTLLDLREMFIHTTKLSHKPIKKVYKSNTYKNFYVIDKVNGGKADSLNAALSYATKEYIVSLDADSVLDMESLHITNNHLQDENIVAAGGMVHVLQAKSSRDFLTLSLKNLKNVVLFQTFEYLKGFYIYKKSLAKLDALAIISGAFGIFRRDILLEIKGYRETLGEDIDVTLRFQKYVQKTPNKKIVFIPEAICYTECPEKWKDLFNQRIRWQKAFIDCVVKHFPFFLTTCLSRTLSFFFLIDAFFVGVMGSYFTFASFIYYGYAHGSGFVLRAAILYLIGGLICNIVYNSIAMFLSYKQGVRLKKNDFWVFIKVMLLDLFFYRFVTLFFVMYGTIQYLFNRKSWNKVSRSGRMYKLESKRMGA